MTTNPWDAGDHRRLVMPNLSAAPKPRRPATPSGSSTVRADDALPLLVDPGSMTVRRVDSDAARTYRASAGSGSAKASEHVRGKPVGQRHPTSDVASRTLIHALLEKTLESFDEVRRRPASGSLTEGDLIREVGEALADKAGGSPQELPADKGWQDLLERGLRSKTALLRSKEFKSTAEASELLGIGEPAVRKRVRDGRLFALKTAGDGEFRIPAWALDPKVSGQATAALLADAQGADEWHVYHFLSTPNGALNGLRPFECLLSIENLPAPQRAARDELAAYLRPGPGASLLDRVRATMRTDLEESVNA